MFRPGLTRSMSSSASNTTRLPAANTKHSSMSVAGSDPSRTRISATELRSFAAIHDPNCSTWYPCASIAKTRERSKASSFTIVTTGGGLDTAVPWVRAIIPQTSQRLKVQALSQIKMMARLVCGFRCERHSDKFRETAGLHLRHDVRPVNFNGARADVERKGDRLVRLSSNDRG